MKKTGIMVLTTFRQGDYRRHADKYGFETLLNTDDFKITLYQGKGREVCFSFLGVGEGFGGLELQREEFFGTASERAERSVIFIFDKKRSWFSNDQKNIELFHFIDYFCNKQRYEKRYAIGNSMGGFGALIAARYMQVDRVLAFCPQFSVNNDLMPEETRWKNWTDRIGKFDIASVNDGKYGRGRFFIIHGADGPDKYHYNRFPKHRNIHHYIVPNADHHVAKKLKARGLLVPVVNTCFLKDCVAVDRLMAANDIIKRDRPFDLFGAVRKFSRSILKK